MPRHVNLDILEAPGRVDGIYTLVNPQVGTTRNGDPYLKCLLRDATGEVHGRLWQLDEGVFKKIEHASFVWIEGAVELYNGQVQVKLDAIRSAEPDEDDLVTLLPSSGRDPGRMFQEMVELLRTLEHPGILALVGAYLADEPLMQRFREAPAAQLLHHAWLGGLLEHTLQVMQLADGMLSLYPELDRDLVLTGLFLHDLAKTEELSWRGGFNYTTEGNLVGHLVRGVVMLEDKARQVGEDTPLPREALLVLQHIVLSHHGRLEHGAAKLPATPEAIFVAHLDDLDAKTRIALTAARPASPRPGATGDFTDRVWALDNTRLYRGEPLQDEPGVDG